MSTWNGLDFFIFLIFALNMVLGMARGATKEMISIMCLSLALIFTIKFTVPLAAFFNSSPLIKDVVQSQIMQNFMTAMNAGPITAGLLKEMFYSISLLICFVGVFSLCEAGLAYSGMQEAFSFPFVAWSKQVGGALGFTRGYVIVLILIAILAFHIYKGKDNGFISNSYFVKLFRGGAARLDGLISAQNPEAYRDVYKDKDLYKPSDVYKQLNSGESIAPPPSSPGFSPPPSNFTK